MGNELPWWRSSWFVTLAITTLIVTGLLVYVDRLMAAHRTSAAEVHLLEIELSRLRSRLGRCEFMLDQSLVDAENVNDASIGTPPP